MADGDANRYKVLKGMDETEFFTLFELHEKKMKEELKKSKTNV